MANIDTQNTEQPIMNDFSSLQSFSVQPGDIKQHTNILVLKSYSSISKLFWQVFKFHNQSSSVLLRWNCEATAASYRQKAPEADEEKVRNVIVTLADAKQISVDAAVAEAFSELDSIFPLNEDLFSVDCLF